MADDGANDIQPDDSQSGGGQPEHRPIDPDAPVGRKLERAKMSEAFIPPSLRGLKRPAPVMHQFPRKDQKTKNPRKVRGGMKIPSTEKAAQSWAGQRWLRLIELGSDGTALSEGLEYCQLGQTRRLEVGAGKVSALVQGRLPKAYRVTLELGTFSRDQWDRLVETMIEQALYSAKLLAGEVPPSIEDVFAPLGLRLFPSEPVEGQQSEVVPVCTCDEPRSEGLPWCKHACCVAMILANELAKDPWIIFRLRGMEKQELLDRLRHHRSISVAVGAAAPVYEPQVPALEDVPDEPLESCLDRFWSARAPMRQLMLAAEAPAVSHPLLRRLGASPFEEGTFPIVGLFATCYDVITKDAVERVVAGDDEGDEPEQKAAEPEGPSPAERRRAATKPKKIGKAKARKPGE